MKKINLRKLLFGIIGTLVSVSASAQEVAPPTITNYDFHDQSCIRNVSDNGKWAVSFGGGQADASTYTNARLINIETGDVTVLGLENDESTPVTCSANDVTDNGMVVGDYKGKPSVWTKENGWKSLDTPLGWYSGTINSVTPDGKYAVGVARNGWDEASILYDLTTGDILDTPGIPTKGSNDEPFQQMRFESITSDGRYINGVGDFSYTWNTVYFIYDRQTNKCIRPGFNEDGTPVQEGILSLSGTFSPNGKWYAGAASVAEGDDEKSCPFRYNMETGDIEIYTEAAVGDYGCVNVDNAGTIYASTPMSTPVRSLYVFVNGFWYPMDDLLSLRYGIDIYGKTGYDNTGTAMGVSGDGKVIASFPDPYRSFVIKMNESFADAALSVNLLKTFTATPADDAAVSSLRTVNVDFKYNVKLLGTKDDIKLTDKDGNAFGRIVGAAVNSASPNRLAITFRSTTLNEGDQYTLTIPAGMVALATDETRTNEQITLHYTGRAKKPVEVVSVSPEAGSALAQLSVSTNPIFLTYDTDVKLAEGATAKLYRDNETEPMATLNLATSTNAAQKKMVLVYPATAIYFYKGNNYKIVIPAGAVTDSNGDNATTTDYSITYEGIYEREIISDNENIYSEDFSYGVANMLLRDGDGNTPNAEMQGYDFLQSGDAYAWVPLRDEDGTDFAAASTSAYTPAGKSDDWMVTPQIFIPDGKCRLDFDAQGFNSSKQDKLKVIVYADETVHNYLNAELCQKMRNEGKVLMDEVVLPGNSDNNLEGDWTTYSFKLDEYAGKNIYVAFVNENEDQSLVFVDNVKVVRDNGFLIALTSETTVVDKQSAPVTGRVIVNAATGTFSDVSVKLLDADKNVLDEVSGSGLSLKNGDRFDFSFNKELPLTVGKENTFYLGVTLGQYSDEIAYTIKDLAFQPTKRVIIEENTGMGCQFCPQGHVAWDYLSELLGNKVILAAYHTYTGDVYESGMTNYVKNFLGLAAAPTAKINRSDAVASPMYRETIEGKTYFRYTSPDGDCWLDMIQKELESDAAADINIAAAYDNETGKVSVPFNAKFALSMEKQNVGLFLIVTENGLNGYQENTFAGQSPDNYIGIEDWCAGGKYGQSRVYPFTQNNVSRAHIGSYYGDTKYLPQTIECNTEYTGTIEFDVPSTVNDINNCNVICMMIDANTGRVINNAQAKVGDTSGIGGINADNSNAEVVARYNAAGQMIAAPQKGLNIIKYANGTTRKVMVK